MLFKKIKFLSYLMAVIFLCTFSAESFSLSDEERECPNLVGRIISLGKKVVEPDILPHFLDMAMNSLRGDDVMSGFINSTFPEIRQATFGEVLDRTFKKINDRNNLVHKAARQIFEIATSSSSVSSGGACQMFGITSGREGEESFTSPVSEAVAFSTSPFDLTEEDYGFFQMGYGVIRAAMDSGEASYSECKSSGHEIILNGLSTFYDSVYGTGMRVPSSNVSGGSRKLDFEQVFSLSRAYVAFTSQAKEVNFCEWYKAAKSLSRLCVLSGEWTEERRKSFFQLTSKSMEERIALFTSGRRMKADEEKSSYIQRTSSQIDAYAHAYLFSYLGGGFFQKEERTYTNGIKDAVEMLGKTRQMYTTLIASVYAEKTAEERGILLQSSLEKSHSYSSLKACFLEDETTPNLTHWFWGEIIFGYQKMEEFKQKYPALFESNGE